MNEQLQNANLAIDDNSDNWEHKCRVLTDRLSNLEHEHKKVVIEVRNDLEFERKRANQFEEKYKNTIKYKNEQQQLKKILSQLNETLTIKENQILQYIKADQDKKRKIAQLDHLNEQLTKTSEEVRLQLTQIQQGAISAILEKDNIIQDLEEKLTAFQSVDTHEMQTTINDLHEKLKELEEKSEAEKKEVEGIVDMKDQELREIRDKFDVQRERYEQKINLLQQEIITFQKHIEKVNEERNHQENIEEKYYLLEQKQRKTEKKLQEFEIVYKTEKQDLIDAIQKLQTELNSKKEQIQELKTTQAKFKDQQKEIKTKTKQLDETKHLLEKLKVDNSKKISQLEQQKKKVQQTLETRISELERAKVESEENIKFEVKTPEKKSEKQADKDGSSLAIEMENMPNIKNTVRRQSSEQSAIIIERLKAQIKQLQQQIDVLNGKLEEEMKDVQLLRERLVATSGSASRSDGEAELLVQIQDLNSYIKKVQHNLMITKLKYAQDQSHWSSRQSQLKKQIDKMDRKCKKQKAELIQRIDRMKKTNTKDKKTDYYQSSLK